jgi:hypothetical protein
LSNILIPWVGAIIDPANGCLAFPTSAIANAGEKPPLSLQK